MPETLTDAQKVLRNDTGIRMAAALEALASEVEPSTVIAPEYDPTLTYAVGDLVIYRSVLYRCTTPIDTPEEWTAAHWTATSVTDEYRQAVAQDVIDTAIEGGLAIVANGNTHAAIASGQYVYIKGHPTLPEGLYKATAAIPLNGTLSSINVSAAGGILNDLTTVEQIPVSLSSDDERFKSTSTATCYRCGRIAILEIYSRWDFSATPYDTGSQVVMTVTGAPTTFTDMRSIAFLGSRIFIGWLQASGNVTVRNFSDVSTNSNAPISISFLYLCS